VTVNKRLLFGSMAAAAAIVIAVGAVAANRENTEDVTISSANDLSPRPIGTNAKVTGRQLPKVDVKTLAGDTINTAELLGRPLVINFWYSTCLPCKKELPAFAAAHRELGDDVRFVGVDALAQSNPASEEAFARDKGIQYELLYDPDGALTSAVGVVNSPQTIFVDANGTIVKQTGQLDEAQLEELIRTNLL
jgi:peroxiredoxin